MTADRITEGFVDLQVEGGIRIKAKIVSGRITFVDDKDRQIKPRRKVKVPEGTIKSLRPLLQEAFGLFGENQDQGYWEKLAEDAPFSPDGACRKLRRAKINHVEATRLLLESEPRVQEALSFGHISDDTLEGFVSLVSASLLREYNRK